MKVTPVKDVYYASPATDYDGSRWLVFQCTNKDKPWNWPKIMTCNGQYYRWICQHTQHHIHWNSDNHTVYYKECSKSKITIAYRA